ncbi:hypothetical protein CFO_g4607 [Ceratocystis platani]|uniref:Pinin/SDK/MemA protein domain-containing protein n=1 Tax=Ceratocystis fimbriata f. sp. platani TaxID=88771 RepID=A0A0F8CQR3_CERFI|nr:hypothetical protein CFO_g4607 [Ceratocystis platani]
MIKMANEHQIRKLVWELDLPLPCAATHHLLALTLPPVPPVPATGPTHVRGLTPDLVLGLGPTPIPALGLGRLLDVAREELKKEEQRRGKRLFGGLLNTLNKSQGNQYNSQATKRRQEIEERQKAKLRQQRVEGDKMRAQRGRKVKELRMREQIVFEEQVMLARHENMRMQAQCLRTRAKPHLFYRPWKLTHDQEDDLDAQYDEVESKISRELASFRRRYDDAVENSSRDSNCVSHSRSRETDDIAMRDHTPSTERSDVRITTQHKEDVPAIGQSREDEAEPIDSENKAGSKSGPVGQSDPEQGNLTESGIGSSGDPTGDGHHTTNPDNMQEDIATQGSAAETTPIELESKAKGGVVPDATATVGKGETVPEQAATATSENQQGIEGEAPAERSALAKTEQTTSVDGGRHDESGDVVLEADEDVLIY